MKTSNNSLAVLSHSQLLHRFGDLVCRDRRCTAEMLAVIAEVDQRKLWATHACPSMFAFCVEHFHMSEAVTAKRIWAARTARLFPVIFEMVARGELHLGAIHRLAKHLTDDNHKALLNRAKHKTSREIDRLVAAIAPKPDVPSRVRALPRRRGPSIPSALSVAIARESLVVGKRDIAGPAVSGRGAGTANAQNNGFTQTDGARQTNGSAQNIVTPTPSTTSAQARDGRRNNKPVVALSPRRYKIEITVDQDTHDQLRMLEDLLSHQHARTDPAAIVSRALDLLLTETLKKKAAITDRPRRKRDSNDSQPETARTRAIPAATRREVWRRDAGRCAFTDDRGNRCSGTRALEYHHIRPYGKGGGHQADNIALRCWAHNQHQADLDFGREFMDRKRTASMPSMPRGMLAARRVREEATGAARDSHEHLSFEETPGG
jgi:5-methylcytosine-specific restriction endonuclease McrA